MKRQKHRRIRSAKSAKRAVEPKKAEGSDLTTQRHSRFVQHWVSMRESARSGNLGAIVRMIRASLEATELTEQLLARIDLTEIELLDREARRNIDPNLLERLDQKRKSNLN